MSRRWVILVVVLSSVALIAGCGDPPTKVGDVCQMDEHCGGTEGSFNLLCDVSIPGGSCVVENCTPEEPPPDKDTPDVPEDEGTCPSGSRCIRECPQGAEACLETEIRNVCRRSCDQQSDCGEVIVCRWKYDKADACKEDCCTEECNGNEICINDCIIAEGACEDKCKDKRYEECKNEMECTPVWPDTSSSPLPDWIDDPPRACILRDRLYEP